MKIYTKTGDEGKTSLIGGKRVDKYDIRIESYGTIDELIAYVGLIRDQIHFKDDKDLLLAIQDRLMTCASIMATDCEDCKLRIPELYKKDIEQLEEEIDKIEKVVQPLQSFILPGGHPIISTCHIARCVCRRAERNCIKSSREYSVNEYVIKYLNRLSDFLFMFARKLVIELNVEEINWNPKL